jgi:hypothetical protein
MTLNNPAIGQLYYWHMGRINFATKIRSLPTQTQDVEFTISISRAQTVAQFTRPMRQLCDGLSHNDQDARLTTICSQSNLTFIRFQVAVRGVKH